MDQSQQTPSAQDTYAKLLNKAEFLNLLTGQGITDTAEQEKTWDSFVSTFKFSLLIKIFSTLPAEQQETMKTDLDLSTADGLMKLVMKVDQGLVDQTIQVESIETLISELMTDWTKAINTEMEEK